MCSVRAYLKQSLLKFTAQVYPVHLLCICDLAEWHNQLLEFANAAKSLFNVRDLCT